MTKQLLALAILFHLSFAAEIIVFGDSWGTYGKKSFHEVFTEKHGMTVDNVAVGGTTAAGWAKDKNALKDAVDKNPDAKYVWLTIGGNDASPQLLANKPIEEIVD